MATLRERRRTKPEARALVTAERNAERAAINAFLEGIKRGNSKDIRTATEKLRYSVWGHFRAALRSAATLRNLPVASRHAMLNFCLENGDTLRDAAQNDLLLLSFYRAVLPRYSGPGLTIYRAATFAERCHHTYGWSWTSNIEVARSFAEKYQHADAPAYPLNPATLRQLVKLSQDAGGYRLCHSGHAVGAGFSKRQALISDVTPEVHEG